MAYPVIKVMSIIQAITTKRKATEKPPGRGCVSSVSCFGRAGENGVKFPTLILQRRNRRTSKQYVLVKTECAEKQTNENGNLTWIGVFMFLKYE